MKLTYTDLVQRLVDLERLAEPPAPDEQGGCCSSYDRRSRYNAETGTYENWDANDDGSGFIRMEGDWMVVFEREGPGVIWRIWSALLRDGRVQIFIDNAPEPVVDMPFRDLFEQFNGEIPPLNFPSLTPTLSRGRNRYIPIPYNRSCKVRLAPEWGAYCHFTYTTFPEDYVGYAWAAEPPFPMFDSPYASQPFVTLDGNGHTSVSRFHICDDVPFHSSFEGCIEKYKGNRWGDGNVFLYAVICYWYQRSGELDPYRSVPLAERVGYEIDPSGPC